MPSRGTRPLDLGTGFSQSWNDSCGHQLSRQLFVLPTGELLQPDGPTWNLFTSYMPLWLPVFPFPNGRDCWGSISSGVEDHCLLALRNASWVWLVTTPFALTGWLHGTTLPDRVLIGFNVDIIFRSILSCPRLKGLRDRSSHAGFTITAVTSCLPQLIVLMIEEFLFYLRGVHLPCILKPFFIPWGLLVPHQQFLAWQPSSGPRELPFYWSFAPGSALLAWCPCWL